MILIRRVCIFPDICDPILFGICSAEEKVVQFVDALEVICLRSFGILLWLCSIAILVALHLAVAQPSAQRCDTIVLEILLRRDVLLIHP